MLVLDKGFVENGIACTAADNNQDSCLFQEEEDLNSFIDSKARGRHITEDRGFLFSV